MSKFGIKLKELRLEKGLNQEQLGKLFHVKKAAISKWENGNTSPDENTINNIADYFDVSIDYLYGRTNKRQPHHLTKEDIVKIAPEYKWLFDEEGLEYVELIEEMKAEDIPPEAIKELVETILKYRHLNK